MALSNFHMIATFIIIGITISLYAWEYFSIEVVSLGTLVALLLLFSFFPYVGAEGPLQPQELLLGFANPALITVLALLIMGEALFQTSALEGLVQFFLQKPRRQDAFIIPGILFVCCVISAFLNNTPVVVMFIPVLAALATAKGKTPAHVLMPLSFMAILGGMTTVIGSSTNLLIVNLAHEISHLTFTLFSFTLAGLPMVIAGIGYILLIMPFLAKTGRAKKTEDQKGGGKQFIAQIILTADHPLIGTKAISGLFPTLKNMTIRLVRRGHQAFLPPFENVTLAPGDEIIVAATRASLTAILAKRAAFVSTDSQKMALSSPTTGLMLAEVVIAPSSRFVNRTISGTGFWSDTRCQIIGIQRRKRMMRSTMMEIRLEAGDVLLISGTDEDIKRLRNNHDVLLLDWSAAQVPMRHLAPHALLIFMVMVVLVATGAVSILVASLSGVLAMLVTKCINLRQVIRAIDSRIYMLVGASIALATALEYTKGTQLLAESFLSLMEGHSPRFVLSILFLLIAILTNVLSNNATAVLFTPVVLKIAEQLGVAPEAFVVSIIFAANCCFATPIGYQTNLIVMIPGQYCFRDFIKIGGPLVLLLWLVFTFTVPWYYGF